MKRSFRFICTVLTVLWLPASGIADEGGTVPQRPAATKDMPPQSGAASGSRSFTQGEAASGQDQKDVRSRGLFSKNNKKKKKKPRGGAAGHTESIEQADRATGDARGAGKND